MFDFLKSKNSDRINNVHLISIHIPKTAGTSFRSSLKYAYGDSKVIRCDIGDNKFHLDEKPFESNIIPNNIEVLHGHMKHDLLIDRFKFNEDVRIITWLRDPVERVISNYRYLSKRLAEELDEEGKGLNILKKMQRSLMEYAHDEFNQNRMSKFLNGIELHELYFVGITEFYTEDFNSLAQLLEWKNIEEYKVNITGKKHEPVSDEDRSTIKKLNAKDVDLYEKAIRLRQNRINKTLNINHD